MAYLAHMSRGVDSRVSIVVLTHDRVDEVRQSIARARALPARPRVIVVDNDSRDGTADAIIRSFPDVTLVRAPDNLGAAGRNLGIRASTTPYVALADDDTWWTDDGLARAAGILDAHPRVAIVSGRVVLSPSGRVDPICLVMAASPLVRDPSLPGPRLAGFLAGASMVRCDAVLSVGGFEPRLFLGSEETLLASDLAVQGWTTMYADDVVVHHRPSRVRDAAGRRRLIMRNDLWFAWRRRPLHVAIARTLRLARLGLTDDAARTAFVAAVRGLPWALATRRPLPPPVEADWRALEAPRGGSGQAPVPLRLEDVGIPDPAGTRKPS